MLMGSRWSGEASLQCYRPEGEASIRCRIFIQEAAAPLVKGAGGGVLQAVQHSGAWSER